MLTLTSPAERSHALDRRTPADALADAEASVFDDSMVAWLHAEMHRTFPSRSEMTDEARELRVAELVIEALTTRCPEGSFAPVCDWTVADVLGWFAEAGKVGDGYARIGKGTLEELYHGAIVPVAPFRERFAKLRREPILVEDAQMGDLAQPGLTVSELAMAVGLTRKPSGGTDDDARVADTTQVERLLGIEPSSPDGRTGKRTAALFIDSTLAARFADALDLDYHDCGL